MSIPGRDQPAVHRGLAVWIALAAVFVAIAAASADTYAPFCEAPIQQCASEDQRSGDGQQPIQLYSSARCNAMAEAAIAKLSSIVVGIESDPHNVASGALILKEVAVYCPSRDQTNHPAHAWSHSH